MEKIYYTTAYQMSGKNELRVCDLDGSMMKDSRRVLSPFAYKMEMMENWF